LARAREGQAHREARGGRRAARPPGEPSALAKLTRPRLHAAYPRQRLFGVLDGNRDRPVVWMAGPPGAGKTTLAATWLEARKLPSLWVQLDAGDSDPGTFFFYLRQAAEAAGARGKAPLPLLTAEYLADVPAFARRWFRELFQRLPRGAVLALDNYQELAVESVLHRALAAACLEVPPPAHLLVMSWVEPPSEFSGFLAREQLARIDPGALKLSVEEAEGIAAGKHALTGEQVRELHAQSDGWAAGFTLMRERARRTGLVNRIDQGASMQEVFDYFMAQAFRDATPEQRQTLVKTAFLPRFTEAMACELSGSAGAGELLEWLYRRHLFVERHYGATVTHGYHALFRAFLRDQARRTYTPLGLAELSRRAAALLEAAGMPEDAVPLLLEGGDRAGAARLVEVLAPSLVAAGRGAALEEWLQGLPDAERDRRPWLSYRLGAALTGVNIREARSAYERAHAGFVREGDRSGQAMAVAELLQTHYLEMDDLGQVRPWLPAVASLFGEDPAFPSRDAAARAYGILVGVMFWVVPDHPLFPVCIHRLEGLLAGPLSPDVKVTAGGVLAEYHGLFGDVARAERLTAAIEPVTREASPFARLHWAIRTCRADYRAGDFPAVRRKLQGGLDLIAEERFQLGAGFIYGLLADVALDLGELDAVPAFADKLRALFPLRGRQAVARHHWMLAKLAALRGDLDEGLRQGEAACAVAGNALALARQSYTVTLVSILIERGELGRAREVLDGIRGLYPADLFPLAPFQVQALHALLDAARNDGAWREPMRQSLRRLRALGSRVLASGQPLLARRLSALLLSEDLETGFVRSWIRKVNLRPASPDIPRWPWAVQVRTLGPFGIELDGAPLTFAGKAPRKPIELLQAIVAFGPAAPAEALENALWPDSEGDAAGAALRVTLSRLRKLLGRDVVRLHQGRLTLDGRLCWVDAWSLERHAAAADPGSPAAPATRLLDLYRGAFLETERSQPWMLRARERLRRLFVASVARLGQSLERDRLAADAIALYRKALQRDEAAEDLHRLVAAARAAGDDAPTSRAGRGDSELLRAPR
jgi:DNA-binding SARP family transcriptional activator